ncbi:hypothetical protein CK203_039337 [Vitis vinifera]|uniref:Uncharacterized protein n=1 Tax=Vitis vinifera TaxID=29760 RepID=A0A438HGM8_VITVI|nr:hypothetical protein CK203_039337 [Vitis vinifera]
MDSQPSRHVVLEDTPSDIVMPPVISVQMPATQTLHTISHDQAAIVPSIVTPVTIVEDLRSRMDRIERRIGQMRDPDEMISWDDPDDVLYSTVMRALGLDEAQLLTLFPLSLSGRDTEMVRFIRVISSENLGGLSTGVSETGEAAEMIERPTERDQMSMFLRSLHPRGLWSDIIPSPDTEGKGVGESSESYGGVCSADFQHRQPSYHPHARSLQTSRSDFPPLQHRHPHPVQQYPFVHPHTVTVRPSFQFSVHRLVSHGTSSLVPIGRNVRGLILIWGCLWIELLSDSESNRWQATVLIIVLLYVTPYRILLTVVRLAFPYRPQILILVQM